MSTFLIKKTVFPLPYFLFEVPPEGLVLIYHFLSLNIIPYTHQDVLSLCYARPPFFSSYIIHNFLPCRMKGFVMCSAFYA